MTFVFVFYIPVQFSKSFPLSFRTARWLSHLVFPLSTVFFISFFPYVVCCLSAHSKCLFTLPWLISCQYSPTARLYYLIPLVLASTVFSDRYTCMHVFIKQTYGFWLIYNNFFTAYKILVLKIFSDFFKYVFAICVFNPLIVANIMVLWITFLSYKTCEGYRIIYAT